MDPLQCVAVFYQTDIIKVGEPGFPHERAKGQSKQQQQRKGKPGENQKRQDRGRAPNNNNKGKESLGKIKRGRTEAELPRGLDQEKFFGFPICFP